MALSSKIVALFEKKLCGAFFGAFWQKHGASQFKTFEHTGGESVVNCVPRPSPNPGRGIETELEKNLDHHGFRRYDVRG